jgi:hypothetical protein
VAGDVRAFGAKGDRLARRLNGFETGRLDAACVSHLDEETLAMLLALNRPPIAKLKRKAISWR